MQSATGSFKSTAFGLRLVYLSIVVLLLAMIGMLAARFVPVPIQAIYAIFGALVVAPLLSLIGRCLCLTVPPETDSRTYIVPAVALDLASIAIRGWDYFRDIPKFLSDIQGPLPLLAFVFFLLFLRKLAKFVGSESETKRATDLLKTGIVIALIFLAAITFAVLRIAPAPSRDIDTVGFILFCITPGAMIAIFFWLLSYVRLLNNVQKLVAPLP